MAHIYISRSRYNILYTLEIYHYVTGDFYSSNFWASVSRYELNSRKSSINVILICSERNQLTISRNLDRIQDWFSADSCTLNIWYKGRKPIKRKSQQNATEEILYAVKYQNHNLFRLINMDKLKITELKRWSRLNIR